jgi:polysaccharide export outer membrane protein
MEKTNKSLVKMIQKSIHQKSQMFYTVAAILILGLSGVVSGSVDEYILKPGDVISVNVVEHMEFSGRHKIRPDGRINYPVIGELDVASLSCAQLVKIMQGKLAPYVNNPVVSVSIEAYYANKIFIIGDVSRAGEFEIYEPIELIKAIAMCGGMKSSNPKKAKIIRSDGTVISVDLRELLSGRMSKRETEKYLLYPGDTLYVPESFSINWGLIATILGIVCVSLQIALYTQNLNHK